MKKTQNYFHHLDIISFKPSALTHFPKLEIGSLERLEGIELLRALEIGLRIKSPDLKGDSFSIDDKEDYVKAIIKFEKDKYFKLFKY